jgi:hypothetical protein
MYPSQGDCPYYFLLQRSANKENLRTHENLVIVPLPTHCLSSYPWRYTGVCRDIFGISMCQCATDEHLISSLSGQSCRAPTVWLIDCLPASADCQPLLPNIPSSHWRDAMMRPEGISVATFALQVSIIVSREATKIRLPWVLTVRTDDGYIYA